MNLPAFKFPDEVDGKKDEAGEKPDEIEIEVVDDTPPEDKGREPLPDTIVKELEDDTLEEYSDKVKKRLSQMKKVWHDERREKEAARREAEEAFRLAQVRDAEIKQLRQKVGDGEKVFSEEMTKAVSAEVTSAKQRLTQAYEEGDPVKIADAQEALTDAKIKLKEVQYRKPSLQTETEGVEQQQQVHESQPVYDQKALAWKAKNTWFGVDEEMTSLAYGLHQKLVRQGVDPRSDDYYRRVDEAMRKRFPENFEGEEPDDDTPEQPQKSKAEKPRKPATVVAPATRSTAPNKVRLTQTQVALAKKFGLTPEQYAKELIKLENQNG
jgi:hypothetical protein